MVAHPEGAHRLPAAADVSGFGAEHVFARRGDRGELVDVAARVCDGLRCYQVSFAHLFRKLSRDGKERAAKKTWGGKLEMVEVTRLSAPAVDICGEKIEEQDTREHENP